MDVIKAQLERIKQQLAGLTATQRMLVAALVAVMAMTMMYWGRYASNPDMVALMDTPLSPENVSQIDFDLTNQGIPHTLTGGKIMVPAERRMEIVAQLMYQNRLPGDMNSVFDEMTKSLNPFSPDSERDATYNHAHEVMLGLLMSQWPNVSKANVIINAKSEQRIEDPVVPTASVFLSLRDHSANKKQLVIAAAEAVSHVVSSLTRGNTAVIIDGMAEPVPNADNDPMALSSDLMDVKAHEEDMEAQKIRNQFRNIQNLLVSVSVDVENRTVSETKHIFDADHTLSKPIEEMSKTDETTSSAPPAVDPGVGANTGASIGTAGSGNQSTSNTEENTKYTILPSDSVTDTKIPAGKYTVQSAVVRVPRSWMVAVYKTKNKGKDPDETALNTFSTTELASIREATKGCVGVKSDEAVSVDLYTDLPITPGPEMAAAASSTSSRASLSTVTSYGKQIAVGVLAVVSLFMMSSMVRKAAPAPIVVAPPKVEPPPMLEAVEGLAGEVGMTNATLDGMELDEDAVHTQQMLDQVSTMVKENPDGAAALVKRWLNRT